MSAIFLSHSSKDNVVAAEIRQWLIAQGHRSVFLDFDPEDGIPTGRNWEQELYRHMRECRAVIVLRSANSMSSRWCFAEITQARALGKAVLPIVIGRDLQIGRGDRCQPGHRARRRSDRSVCPLECGAARRWRGPCRRVRLGWDPAAVPGIARIPRGGRGRLLRPRRGDRARPRPAEPNQSSRCVWVGIGSGSVRVRQVIAGPRRVGPALETGSSALDRRRSMAPSCRPGRRTGRGVEQSVRRRWRVTEPRRDRSFTPERRHGGSRVARGSIDIAAECERSTSSRRRPSPRFGASRSQGSDRRGPVRGAARSTFSRRRRSADIAPRHE